MLTDLQKFIHRRWEAIVLCLACLELQGVGFVRWRTMEANVIYDGYRVTTRLVLLFGVGIIIGRNTSTLRTAIRTTNWLVGLAAWYLLSAVWSISPGVTLELGAFFAYAVLVVIAMQAALTWRLRLNVLAASLLASGFISVMFHAIYGTQLSAGAGWVGAFPAAGGLGANALLGSIVLSWAAIEATGRVRFVFGFGALLQLALLVLSRSDSAILAFAAGSAVAFIVAVRGTLLARYRTSPIRATIMSFGIAACFGGGALAIAFPRLQGSVLDSVFARDGSRNLNLQLSGRTKLWKFLPEYLEQRPLTGFGFHTFWTGPRSLGDFTAAYTGTPSSTHNSYIESLIDAGPIALVLVILVFAAAIRSIGAYESLKTRVVLWSLIGSIGLLNVFDSYLGHIETIQIASLAVFTVEPTRRAAADLRARIGFTPGSAVAGFAAALVIGLLLFGRGTEHPPIDKRADDVTWEAGRAGALTDEEHEAVVALRQALEADADPARRQLAAASTPIPMLRWWSAASPDERNHFLPFIERLDAAADSAQIVTDLERDVIGVLARFAQRRTRMTFRLSDQLGRLAGQFLPRADLRATYLREGRLDVAGLMQWAAKQPPNKDSCDVYPVPEELLGLRTASHLCDPSRRL